jgi:L-seryl-tRNA(Ser) seleniumtransferase
MIAVRPPELRRRAQRLIATVGPVVGKERIIIEAVDSTVGGGSLPGETLPSVAVSVQSRQPHRLQRLLCTSNPAVIGRVQGGRLVLDMRTVLPDEDRLLADALGALDRAAQ